MESPDENRDESPTPSPNDHVRTLIELLRPAGPDLARRWLAALLIVPDEDRTGVVEEVERRVIEVYAEAHAAHVDETLLDIAEPPVQREGFIEQIIRTYARAPRSKDAPRGDRARPRSAS